MAQPDIPTFPGCKLGLTAHSLRIYAPSKSIAQNLLENYFDHLQISAKKLDKQDTEIYYPGCKAPLRILAFTPGETMTTSFPTQTISSNLVIPELELDFNGIYNHACPIYIFDFSRGSEGEILFTNPAGLAAQSKTKLTQMKGDKAATLNFPEELELRLDRLRNGEQLKEYENKAMRWFLDQETNLYCRKQMNFISNAGRIQFLGDDCWYSMTLDAQETGQVIG